MSTDFTSLKTLSESLRKLPQVVANKVASEAAGALTEAARETFEAGQNAFGETWLPGAEGQTVSLRDTGDLAKGLSYAATGSKLRAKFDVPYAKYQLGKRPAFPRQGDPLPPSYVKALKAATAKVLAEEALK